LRDLDHQQHVILQQVTTEKDKLEREKQQLKLLFKRKKFEANELEQKILEISSSYERNLHVTQTRRRLPADERRSSVCCLCSDVGQRRRSRTTDNAPTKSVVGSLVRRQPRRSLSRSMAQRSGQEHVSLDAGESLQCVERVRWRVVVVAAIVVVVVVQVTHRSSVDSRVTRSVRLE
jgi:hypothetical protein